MRGDNGSVACDHLHRWEADLDLVRHTGLDSYRFSTSWARVMPDGHSVNPDGLDFYDRLMDGMLARGITPLATLYHWEMPAALQDLGGWRNRDVAAWFGEVSGIIAERLGDRLAMTAPSSSPGAWRGCRISWATTGPACVTCAPPPARLITCFWGTTSPFRPCGPPGYRALVP